jgi:hypothetical protein
VIPIVQYTVDDWPWEPLGTSLIDNVSSIEKTKRKHERQADAILTVKKNPPMGYDRTATGGPKIENFDLFKQDVRMGVDGQPKNVFQSLLPDHMVVEESDFKFIEYLEKAEKQQLGLDDLASLMNLKMNMSSDSFDKAVESIGPIAKGIAATMEAGNMKVGYITKFLILQYVDTKRIIEYLGPNKTTPEMFDFDPDSLVPSHMTDEMLPGGVFPHVGTGQFDGNGAEIMRMRDSKYTKLERARIFAKNLRLIQVPSTLLKITQMQEQLKVQSAFTRGFPLPPDYVAEKLGFTNWGSIPGTTLLEKWTNWEKLKLALAAQAKELAAKLGLGEAPQMGGAQHGGGRPPSDKKGPKQVMKDKNSGKPRPVTKTS